MDLSKVKISDLFNTLVNEGYDFFAGVPDSALKIFQNDIIDSKLTNIIATHESQALAMAFGASLAGKKACVYLQNSGLGNIINPLTSLCIPFDIKPFLVIGHRHTLSQHRVMGEIDDRLMKLTGYGEENYFIYHGENNVK